MAVDAVNPPGPDQLKLTPAVGDVPVKVTVVTLHVNIPETEALAPGGVMSCSTVTESEDTQPFTGLVTVKM